ncbi:hypothetical protein [Vibrio phage vB_VmeM-Yong XC32]|nr:hypothetical protein [Vibrio phage vB_VmeM-Yong XC31]QAX96363.1 hypothetical protein [Vibrio phage vB_VmeM-Yong XC32]QAX96681.1 hypothetical protein [Vibrio phage vB_VmeM-Yong MS31]QAX96999.1 hypothetical protein [Vibrio phage vB_VmeM-Yong MS32]
MTDSVFRVPAEALPWIRETAFRDIFLPGFVEGDEAVCQRWIDQIAVNPFSQVRVVDDEDETIELFRVPALRRSAETQVGGNFNAVFANIDRVSKAYPPKTTMNYIQQELGGRFEQVDESDADLEAWAEIAQRYGYDRVDGEEQKQETQGQQNGHETFVDDDWP